MKTGYEEFISPPPDTLYSRKFFQCLSIAELSVLTYPTIAPPSSVTFTEFCRDIPVSASATTIFPKETVPLYEDLLQITEKIEEQYNSGMRSARIHFTHMGIKYNNLFHFSKIGLIRNCSNYWPAYLAVRQLTAHLELPRFYHLQSAIQTFKNSKIISTFSGLYGASFPLYKLGCLLGEAWLDEDVFNAMLELTYLRCQIPDSLDQSNGMLNAYILPTFFLTNACQVFKSYNSTYTPEIVAFRERIAKKPAKTVAFGSLKNDHFTAYVYHMGSDKVYYGDSLHHQPPPNVVSIFQWIFKGMSDAPIAAIVVGNIHRQGEGGGEGSCGLAAHNFIERLIPACAPINTRSWCGSEAKLFRDSVLGDMLLYHHIAFNAPGNFADWTQAILPPTIEIQGTLDAAVGFDDFNNHIVLSKHPIYMFQKNRQEVADLESETMGPNPAPRTPLPQSTKKSIATPLSHDPLGPAIQYPYLPAESDYGGPTVYRSCRPGGPFLFDLLGTLPTEPFGALDWDVIDREDEAFEADDLKEEHKAIQALWVRWIMLNRNIFVSNYFKGCISFVDQYWKIIHNAAGWGALRYQLLVLHANQFLNTQEVAQVLVHYERLTDMKYCYS